MKKYQAIYIFASIMSLSLSSCQTGYDLDDLWSDHSSQTQNNASQKSVYYTQSPSSSSKKSSTNDTETPGFKKGIQPTSHVSVPKSYYLAEGVPVSHQTSDKDWIDQQSTEEYTIELSDNKSPAVVAKTIQEAPKNARMAQVQYNDDGKNKSLGVYGSFSSKQAAEEALAKLPPAVRENAKIQSWNNIQKKTASAPISTNVEETQDDATQ